MRYKIIASAGSTNDRDHFQVRIARDLQLTTASVISGAANCQPDCQPKVKLRHRSSVLYARGPQNGDTCVSIFTRGDIWRHALRGIQQGLKMKRLRGRFVLRSLQIGRTVLGAGQPLAACGVASNWPPRTVAKSKQFGQYGP